MTKINQTVRVIRTPDFLSFKNKYCIHLVSEGGGIRIDEFCENEVPENIINYHYKLIEKRINELEVLEKKENGETLKG